MSKFVFHRPPLDGTKSVDQMYDWHRIHSPNAPAFTFSNEDTSGPPMTTLSWKELGDGIIRGIKIIEDQIPELEGSAASDQEPILLGFLATSDTITYTAFLLSHVRLTHPVPHRRALLPFLISPRNSPAAISHLVALTGTKYLWVTPGPMTTLKDKTLNMGGLRDTKILKMPSFGDLFPPNPLPIDIPNVSGAKLSLDVPALIIHSSGSTAFPKTRPITHRILLDWSRSFDQSELNGLGEVMAIHASPAHHAIGILIACSAPVTGYIRCVPLPNAPFVPITPEYYLHQVVKSNSTILITVPSLLEAWSKERTSIEKLRNTKAILWGGALLRPDVGNHLYKEGLPIQGVFSATEFGVVSSIAERPHKEGYEWFKLLPHITPVLIPERDNDGIFELAFKNTELHHVSVLNTEIDGTPAYATNDLVEQHPTNPALFRVIGRKDDQIMLSTGEKTNPGPLETIIIHDPHVENALIFGRGRFQNGVLIEPSSYEEFVNLGLENFRNLIWPSVEAANNFAPAHSRIFKEMILVAREEKPFQCTFKGNVRRATTLDEYDAEIAALYKSIEDSSQVDIAIPDGSHESGGWSIEGGTAFVGKVVKGVMKGVNEIRENDDVFALGCDSLQATYIRNSLLHALRQAVPPSIVQTMPSNFVYQYPTISSLASYVVGMTSHSDNPVASDSHAERDRIQRLDTMITKYTQNWPISVPLKGFSGPSGETILLTGSTGGLGSQLLAQLVDIPTVSRIYALNRPGKGGESSRDRHAKAFLDRGNDVSLLDSSKIIFVEGDTSVEGFGVDAVVYSEIRDSVTTIIHNAWRVDFNIPLSSFEPLIRSLRVVVDMALQSPHLQPPRIVFTSSTGIIKSWTSIPCVSEGPITDIGLLSSTGYGESKWVSERILSAARRETTLRPLIIRVGQLCGGINGNWNAREWFPALVRASQIIGGVPELPGVVSFVPLNVAASAIIELRNSPEEFAHVVHPRPVTWNSIAGHITKALELPLLWYEDWLHRLEASPTTDDALQANPALHLIGLYRASIAPGDITHVEDREAMGLPIYETARTVAGSPSLRPENLPQLDKKSVDAWIGYWRQKGYLDI